MAEEFTVQIRLPEQIQSGSIIDTKLKVRHPSRTGLTFVEDAPDRFGRFIRGEPAVYVKTVEVFYDDEQVSILELNSSTSDNPLLVIKLRADKEAQLRVVATNHKGETVEAAADVKFS